MNSKKIIFVFCIFALTLLFALPAFSIENPVGFQMSLGTGITFYGDTDILSQQYSDFPKGSSRFVLNNEYDLVFFLNELVSLNTGFVLGFDNFSAYGNDMFLLKYDVCFGARVFPMLKGFCFGIDYICGGYTNFLKIDGAKSRYNGDWSNGFRFATEFNFMNNKKGWSPAIGAYWQFMPRNGGYDNSIVISVKASVR